MSLRGETTCACRGDHRMTFWCRVRCCGQSPGHFPRGVAGVLCLAALGLRGIIGGMDPVSYRPDERPEVEVLVDGVWFPGELRMWFQHEDGSWRENVMWSRVPGENRLDNVPAERVGPMAGT